MIERNHQRDFWTTATAIYSDCVRYRYRLLITWDESLPKSNVIGLNPSTATERKNDPTIERLQRWATRSGYGSLAMYNAYAFRSTDPNGLLTVDDPVGQHNDMFIRSMMCEIESNPVAAWGDNIQPEREYSLVKLANQCGAIFRCWGRTKSGNPKHPLYLSNSVLDNPKFVDLSIPVEVV